MIKWVEIQPFVESILIIMALGALGGIARIFFFPHHAPSFEEEDELATRAWKIICAIIKLAFIGSFTAVAFWGLNYLLGTAIGQLLLALLTGIAGNYVMTKIITDLLGAETVRELSEELLEEVPEKLPER